ncbi:MAG: hypothetical protein PG981_000577 [Wolbachia endosymbiont of Ctenocephalides orientis wCori]|nr:MAG: hypothetical protein PG981_000577 [Wolbachia endosymbiont of Ctenocephalides orientis wCori]
MKKFLLLVVLALFFAFDANANGSPFSPPDSTFYKSKVTDETEWVMCHMIYYLHNIGGPIITLVIIGASLLSIFGGMSWPVLFALGTFTTVFFGASTILQSIVPGTHKCGAENWDVSVVPIPLSLLARKSGIFSWFW